MSCALSIAIAIEIDRASPCHYDSGMPSQNTVKIYVPDGYYHSYNRGVEKRRIFLDDQDYRVFLSFIKAYLSPQATNTSLEHPLAELTGSRPVRIRPLRSFAEDVSLLCYCLMPNHFHLLLYQKEADGMARFFQALCTSYSMYFNKRYHRIGTLFQGPYKAAYVDGDSYLLHLSRYIHLNPGELRLTGPRPVTAREYPYSSYPYYLHLKQAAWLHPDYILDYFRSARRKDYRDFLSYESFVEDYGEDSRFVIGKMTID